VPRKNLRLLVDRPLIAWTAESALNASQLSDVVLSTEDAEIAQVGRELGLDVPFLRPAELATDSSPTLPVVQHALSFLGARGDSYDAVCLLQPTQPFRTSRNIDEAISLFIASGADSVVSVLPIPTEHHPCWAYLELDPSPGKNVPSAAPSLVLATGAAQPIARRQDLPRAYHREGSIYVTRSQVIKRDNSLYGTRMVGYPMSPEHSVNIDTLDDWQAAEEMARALRASATMAGVPA
jgi:CMP-N-acetylneuraminic acid synthetase